MSKVYIGTSGFSYPHWGNGIFYPQDLPQRDWFLYYTKYFDTVELNVSFYRLPRKEVFAGWRRKAGPEFVFSIKGSRFITHIKKLKDCQESVKVFFEAADSLRGLTSSEVRPPQGKNVVLWQLPPGLKANLERLESFLKILPKTWRYAFEFRNESWVDREALTLLLRSNRVEATVVFQDWQDWPRTTDYADLYHGLHRLVKELPFVYIRFHGNRDLYSSEYTKEELKAWASDIRKWLKQGKDVYVYFNNDALGYAVPNAQQLKKLVEYTQLTRICNSR